MIQITIHNFVGRGRGEGDVPTARVGADFVVICHARILIYVGVLGIQYDAAILFSRIFVEL